MAVAISRTADPAGVSASSSVVTYSGISIGTAAEDRIVVLAVVTELASASPNSATIDYGTGAVAMTGGTQGNFGAVYARVFRAPAPTGTTATFTVTFGANANNTQNHVVVHRVVGADPTTANIQTGGNGSTDMDATAPLTTGSVTIATGGGFVGIAAGATDTVAKTWANATEDLDADGGGMRYTNAMRTTAGTVTITVTGGTNNEDGALSWFIFKPGTFVNANNGSYSVTGTAASTLRGRVVTGGAGSYAVTGTAATLVRGKTIVAAGGSYAVTGQNASLLRGRTVIADAGSYAVTGTAATLKRALLTTAGAGSYAVTGSTASLLQARRVAADGGAYSVTGSNAALLQGRLVTAGGGSYSITGSDATLVYTPLPTGATTLAIAGGSYLISGGNATLSKTTIAAEQPDIDPDGVARFERGKRKAEEERRKWEDDRRVAVEKAFDKVFGEPKPDEPVKVTSKQRQTAAYLARQYLDAEGVRTSMREIRRLLDEYAAAIEAERQIKARNDMDALTLLLMVA